MEVDPVCRAGGGYDASAGVLHRLVSPLFPRTLRRHRGMDRARVGETRRPAVGKGGRGVVNLRSAFRPCPPQFTIQASRWARSDKMSRSNSTALAASAHTNAG